MPYTVAAVHPASCVAGALVGMVNGARMSTKTNPWSATIRGRSCMVRRRLPGRAVSWGGSRLPALSRVHGLPARQTVAASQSPVGRRRRASDPHSGGASWGGCSRQQSRYPCRHGAGRPGCEISAGCESGVLTFVMRLAGMACRIGFRGCRRRRIARAECARERWMQRAAPAAGHDNHAVIRRTAMSRFASPRNFAILRGRCGPTRITRSKSARSSAG